MWDLIVSVPDHCLSFYFSCFVSMYFIIQKYINSSVRVPSSINAPQQRHKNQIDHYDKTKKRTLGKIHCEPESKETISRTTAGQAKDKSSSINPFVKVF